MASPPLPHRPVPSLVQNVVKKLSSDDRANVTKETISIAEETLRKVAIKIKVGGLGKGDSIENRAAIVLDLILRQNGKASIPNLSKICSMKKKDFENMSAKVGHYANTGITKQAQGRHHPRQHKHQPHHASSRFKVIQSEKKEAGPISDMSSVIPILSIKLGSHIPDCHGFAKQAQYLINEIQVYVSGLNDAYQRSGYLQDMERKKTEYEAACFFKVLEENEVQHVDQLKPMVVQTANVQLLEFDEIYKEVKKFHAITKLGKKRSPPKNLKFSKRQKLHLNSTNQQSATDLIDDASSSVGATSHATLCAEYKYSDCFQRWRAKTIETALMQARSSNGTLSHSQALHVAADGVLRRLHSSITSIAAK